MESQAIVDLIDRVDDQFEKTVDCCSIAQESHCNRYGKIRAHRRQRFPSTLTSTGTPSLFLHPAESSHGDLGVIGHHDIVIAISNGGESDELFPILTYVARRNSTDCYDWKLQQYFRASKSLLFKYSS